MQIKILTVSNKGSLLHEWQLVEEKRCWALHTFLPFIVNALYNNNFVLNYQQGNFIKFHYNAFIQGIDNERRAAVKYPLKKTHTIKASTGDLYIWNLETGVDWDFHWKLDILSLSSENIPIILCGILWKIKEFHRSFLFFIFQSLFSKFWRINLQIQQ